MRTQDPGDVAPDSPVAVVADDDGVTRRVLTLLLQRQGYRVLVAVDGEGALQLVRDVRPGVVFLDARMPAPDGYDVCRTIRAESPSDAQPYITMITAAGQDDDRERAADVGVDEFLTKPFSPSHLSARLRALQARPSS